MRSSGVVVRVGAGCIAVAALIALVAAHETALRIILALVVAGAIALLVARGRPRSAPTTVVPAAAAARAGAVDRTPVSLATARMSLVLDDVAEPLALLASDLASTWWAGCRIDVRDDDGQLRVVALAPSGESRLTTEADAAVQRANDTATVVSWASGLAVPLRDSGGVLGALAVATSRSLTESELAEVTDVARVVSSAIERAALLRQTRLAVRRSQRIARQLHQLIAAAIAVAGLRTEQDILVRLARSVRSVFDADEVVVHLDEGTDAPVHVLATRAGERVAPSGEEAVHYPALGKDLEPVRTEGWVVAPILAGRGAARGAVAVRRAASGGFGEDDVEVLRLLTQMAASSLSATEKDRAIVRGEARWRVLVEAAPIGLIEVVPGGGVLWWNGAAAATFGWSPWSPGVDTVEFPPSVTDALSVLSGDVLAGSDASGRELLDVEVLERTRDLTAVGAVLAAHDGATPTVLLLVDDVTEQRQLVDELHHAQRMEVIGQLSSSVAHDFNNLLTLIAGYAELLGHRVADDEHARTLTGDIQAATVRAKTLTGKLLTIGRTKSPSPVAFVPAAVIDGLSEVLARILGPAIELQLRLDPAAGAVLADPDQFEQTILNLAVNARDAMESGGSLTIELAARDVDAGVARERDVSAGPYVQILLTDTGEGMDDETQRRCFEPLFTTKGPSKGTGLGLPAARRVVTESGGSIVCRSVLGKGTTFDLLLPSTTETADAAMAPRSPAEPHEPATVLLAEDEEGIRTLVARVLAHNGYDVLEAASGEEALERAAGHAGSIDLLVSDVVMGAMSGRDLALGLQADRPELLVVLASGNVDATILEGLRPGSASFLSKPFRPSQLLDVVAELRAKNRVAS